MPSWAGPTVLPTTLVSELARMEYSPDGSEPLEVVAACMRHREAALIYLQHQGLIWPITVFPRERLYHSPRDLTPEIEKGVRHLLRIHSVEPPGVRAPGHFMTERVAEEKHYRQLDPLLWALGLHGPRGHACWARSAATRPIASRPTSMSARCRWLAPWDPRSRDCGAKPRR